MASLTSDLGRFVSELTLEQVPGKAIEVVKTGFADCFGVMIAGARQPFVGLVDRELGGADRRDQASLIPSGERRNAEHAALVNGVAAHVLDYDDCSSDGHPSAVLVPTILAQGEVSGSSGAEMLAAYIAGYEVWAELLEREPIPLHHKGWHPTAVRGTVAAAAVCAKLLRLSPEQTTTALALAGSMACGLVANFGTLTKPFQVGRTGQSGMLAARLASKGMTASPDALEHRAGFLKAFSPQGSADTERPFDARQKQWYLLHHGLNVKRYPVCYAAHRAIDAALDLVEKHNVRAADVDQVRVSIGELQMQMLRNAQPQTGFEAKFSMPFAMASSIVARKVGLSELTDPFVLRSEVQDLMPRVRCTTTSEALKDTGFAPADTVEIRTANGGVLASKPVAFAKGSRDMPLSRDELWVKFADCLGEEFPAPVKNRAFERLMSLERLNGANEIVALQS